MNKKYLIGGGLLLLLIAVGSFFIFRKKEDEPTPTTQGKPEPPKVDAPDVPLLPDYNNPVQPNALQVGGNGQVGGGGTIVTDVNGSSKPAIMLGITHPTVVARRAQLASDYARSQTASNTIKGRYTIGDGLFDGIAATAAAVTKNAIAALFTNLQVDNLMQYPVFSKYTHPELLAQLKLFAENYGGGITINSFQKNNKMNPALKYAGWLEAINFNIVTGTNRPSEFTTDEITYFVKSNGLVSGDGLGMFVGTLAKNWIREIEDFNAALESEAINKMLHEGWRIEGYSAPFADEV